MNDRSYVMRCGVAVVVLTLWTAAVVRGDPTSDAAASREIKVLGIGNSFTGNAFSLLHPMGSRSDKCRIVLGQGIIGGCSMEKHMRLAKLHEADPKNEEGRPYALTITNAEGERVRTRVGLRELLASDTWDIVTIQQLSAQSPDIANYRPYARELYDYIKKYAPQAEVVLHQTWAYRADGDFAKVFPDKPSYSQEDMYRDLTSAYTTIAEELDVRVIPVGAAFQMAREARPYMHDPSTDNQNLRHPISLATRTRSAPAGTGTNPIRRRSVVIRITPALKASIWRPPSGLNSLRA